MFDLFWWSGVNSDQKTRACSFSWSKHICCVRYNSSDKKWTLERDSFAHIANTFYFMVRLRKYIELFKKNMLCTFEFIKLIVAINEKLNLKMKQQYEVHVGAI